MKKFIIIAISLAILAIIAAAGFFLKNPDILKIANQSNQKPVYITLATAAIKDIPDYVSSPGEIEPLVNLLISARVSARIIDIPFKEGQKVTKGQTIIKLDDSDLKANLDAIQANRNAQKIQIDVAKVRLQSQEENIQNLHNTLALSLTNLNRQLKLKETGDISQATLDTATQQYQDNKSRLKTAKLALEADILNIKVMGFQLESTDANITKAKEDLSYTTIESPITGTLIRINKKVGEMTVAGTLNNAGTAIMEIADFSNLIFTANVDESSIGKLRLNQEATVTLQSYPDKTYTGIVNAISHKHDTDGSNKYYKTKIILNANEDLRYTGLTGDVNILTKNYKDAISIPTQSVLSRRIDQLPDEIKSNKLVDPTRTFASIVYIIKNNKAVALPVTVGPYQDNITAITAGLKVGDKVIDGPFKALKDLKHNQLTTTNFNKGKLPKVGAEKSKKF